MAVGGVAHIGEEILTHRLRIALLAKKKKRILDDIRHTIVKTWGQPRAKQRLRVPSRRIGSGSRMASDFWDLEMNIPDRETNSHA